MRLLSMVAVLLAAFAVASAAGAADPALGKKVYEKNCAGCHGADGKGDAQMEQTLNIKIPALASAATKSNSELLKAVSEGKKPMPGFGKRLSKDELAAVVQYSKALATGGAAGGK